MSQCATRQYWLLMQIKKKYYILPLPISIRTQKFLQKFSFHPSRPDIILSIPVQGSLMKHDSIINVYE